MNIRTACMVFKTDRPIIEGAEKLRGFIAGKFPEYPIFHNHLENGYLFTYSRIQYKNIDGVGYILGIEEGSDMLKKIIGENIDKLYLGNGIYEVEQKIFYENNERFMPTREPIQYVFLTPWLALNEENYQKRRKLKDRREKKMMLNQIIVGNIISMCKGLGYDVEPYIYAHSRLKEVRTEFHCWRSGFVGEFRTNFKIPDLFGLGKGASHGFGSIMAAPMQ